MSMAKRRQDLKDPAVRKRIEEYLKVKVGDRTVWMRKEKEAMAEQIKVVSDGEDVVLYAEGAAGQCTVRMRLEEAERFRDILDRAISRAVDVREAREVEESGMIEGVDNEGEWR